MYYIHRNNQSFGPYSIEQVAGMVQRGNVLKCDKVAGDDNIYRGGTVGEMLIYHGIKVRPRPIGTIAEQFKRIGSQVLFPENFFRRDVWKSNTDLLLMTCVGLLPTLLGILAYLGSYLTFYGISLYFSVIWGLFFYYLFKTRQVSLRTTLLVFFGTQLCSFTFWDVMSLPPLINPFYSLSNSPTISGRILYFVLGVGLTEEFVKALPLFFLMAKAREPLVPQTFVYYALMSGIAFGVYEGVEYQTGINSELGYASSFLANIARLTSLPFIHAVWVAIAGYFVSFALLYPGYKKAMLALAIIIPALLHGFYDVSCSINIFPFPIIRIVIMVLSVVLLMTYLKNGKTLQHRLSSGIN